MRWGVYLVASAAVLPLPAFAQETQSTIVPLWRDIVPGDSPETVATKLRSLPEIKAAKVIANADPTKTKIKISYNGEGIDVFGEKFKLAVIFDNQGVTRIGLAEYETCAHDLYDRYERIYDALAAKYPDSPLGSGLVDQSQKITVAASAMAEKKTVGQRS